MEIKQIIEKYRPSLDKFETEYKDLHQNPELSDQESRTASVAAKHLESLSFNVHRDIGGHGVVGVFENGVGRNVLLRADMDALPVEEKTELPYASRARMVDSDGKEKPVCHACGHDMHVTSLMAVATLLVSARKEWHGTSICLFQPNEERAGGARAMVDDGLYEKIPKPDLVLGQHVIPLRTGSVWVGPGAILTAASTLNIRVHGRGSHGSEPQRAVDPVMLAGYILVRLQSIVSRGTNPQEPVVVTCGSIHGGDAANVIPSYVDLGVNVRTYSESLHEKVLDDIKRIVTKECEAAQAPEPPEIKVLNRFPATTNDEGLYRTLKESFGEYFKENSVEAQPFMASEDFSILADAVGAPYVYWGFGGTDPKKFDDALRDGKLAELPGNHSPYFAPVIQPTLTTGVDAMSVAALTFLH